MASRPSGVPWVLAVFFGTGDEKQWSNDMWYNLTGTPIDGSTDLVAIATAIYSGLTTTWAAAITTSEKILGVSLEMGDGTGNVWSTVFYSTTDGTGISSPMPEDVAVVVRKKTAIGTASGKGRWYFYGAGQGDVSGSYLAPAGVTDWQAFAVALKATVTAGAYTLKPSHFSKKTNLFTEILDTPVVGLLGTRRRRRGKY
jgi:hypothetical protein